jgi:multiple antibiotic resistance protein
MVAAIVLTHQHPGFTERLAVVAGAAVALIVVLAALRFASALGRLLRPSAIRFLTRIMGLLLTAIAVQLVADAVRRWIQAGLG